MENSLRLNMWFVHELRRWFFHWYFWFLFLFPALWIVVLVYSYLETGISSGSAATLTESLLTTPYAVIVCVTILGISITGADFDTKFSNSLFMLGRSNAALIAIKSLVAVFLSLPIGVVNLAVARLSTRMLLEDRGIDFSPQTPLLEWGAGYMAAYLTSAVLGVALALLVRGTMVSMWGYIIYVTGIEAAILSAFPEAGKWLLGGAQAAIVQDVSLPERLDVLPGLGVYILWLMAIFAVAVFIFRRFPEPPVWKLKRAKAQQN